MTNLFDFFFFFNNRAPPEIHPLPLHDPLPIWGVLLAPELVYLVVVRVIVERRLLDVPAALQDRALALQFSREASLDEAERVHRSEEHTSELQSRQYLVCRLLLEKKKTTEQLLE